MKQVAVIIVNFNGQKYLPALFESLYACWPKTVAQQIVVVDNCSTDGSVEWLKHNYPLVEILAQAENYGFAKGNNIGMDWALEKNFDYIMLLNQDTRVTAGYLDILVAQMEKQEKAAAVQPTILLYPEVDLLNSRGNVIHYLGFGYTAGHKTSRLETRDPSRAEPRDSRLEVNYCSGAACLLKCSLLKVAGLFDENLFMYHEDLDLGWRFKLLGYQNQIASEAVVYHQYEFSRSIKKYYFMERNRFIVMLKNYKIPTWLLIAPALLLMEVGVLSFSFFNGWWREKLRIYLYFFQPQNLLFILHQRRIIQKMRRQPDRAVVKDFAGVIKHQETESIAVNIMNIFFNVYWRLAKKLIVW